MAQAGTVAVLLPCAFYYLKETKKPPVELLIAYKIPLAMPRIITHEHPCFPIPSLF